MLITRKRAITALVVLGVVFVTLVALSLIQAASSTTITWWVPNWDEPVARELVAEFQKENPNIKVEMVITTWETMADKIRVALMSNNPPDIITELESRTLIYAAKGLLTKLDSRYAKDLDKSDFVESALATGTYKGSIYSVPFRHDGSGMYYNKEMFRAAGLDPEKFPATWDEFIAAAKKLTKDTDNDGVIDQYGMAWPFGNQPNAVTRFLIQLYSNGGEVLNKSETKCLLDEPVAITAMRQLTDTIIKDKVAPKTSLEIDNTGLRALFTNRKIAMMLDGAYDIEPIKQEAPDLDFGTAVIPGPNGMGTTTANGFALIMPKKAKHPNEAWRLMSFIAKPEKMTRLTNTFPARKSALNFPQFSTPLLKPFAKQLTKAHAEPSYTQWPEMERIIYHYMQRILLGETSVEKAMKSVTTEINKLLSK